MKMSASSRIYLTSGSSASKYFASADRSRVKLNSKINDDSFIADDHSSNNLSQNNGLSA
jgi:hypothetical protein